VGTNLTALGSVGVGPVMNEGWFSLAFDPMHSGRRMKRRGYLCCLVLPSQEFHLPVVTTPLGFRNWQAEVVLSANHGSL
jgi:hypothetical protein